MLKNHPAPPWTGLPIKLRTYFLNMLECLVYWIVEARNHLFNIALCLFCQDYSHAGQPRQREKLLVCNPDPRNITQIFIPLTKFIEEIEHAIGCTPGRPCTLNAFLSDYIKEGFLGRHHMMVAASIESATKSVDAWRATTSPEVMRGLGLSRPLLQVSNSCTAFSTAIPHLKDLKEEFSLLKMLT